MGIFGRYDPRKVEDYYGARFTTKHDSVYGITSRGHYLNKYGKRGQTVTLIAGFDAKHNKELRGILRRGRGGADDLERYIREHGHRPTQGLLLVMALEKSGENQAGILTSPLKSIKTD